MKSIEIVDAYENNLQHITLGIPQHSITAVTGVSGSGKSSLIYHVLAAEAQRREKIDRGNAHCLDYAVRPKFKSITNLPYCVTLRQRGLAQTISSTIATVTTLHELLRTEFVQYGTIVAGSGNTITKPSAKTIKAFLEKFYAGKSLDYFALPCHQKYTDARDLIQELKAKGIKEAIFISSYDNKEKSKPLGKVSHLNPEYQHTIMLPLRSVNELEAYEALARDSFLVRSQDPDLSFHFGVDYPDLATGEIYQKKSGQLLSFNSTSVLSGRCGHCDGKGYSSVIDWHSLISKSKKLNEHFLNLEQNHKGDYKHVSIYQDNLDKEYKKHSINSNRTYDDLEPKHQSIIRDIIQPKLEKHKNKESISRYFSDSTCPQCHGTRFNEKANAIKLFDLSISQALDMSAHALYEFLQDKPLQNKRIMTILHSINKSTLGYLALNRTTDNLSGGELQRLKLAIELNSQYNGLLYILDEPSIALHPYNNNQLIQLIIDLKNNGNSVIISEHNYDYINRSDHVIELGPGSGNKGGEVVFNDQKRPEQPKPFIREKKHIDMDHYIELKGVCANNIHNEDFTIPLQCLVSICGVSGSGKSSLIHKVLVPTVKRYLKDKTFDEKIVTTTTNLSMIDDVIELTQAQIGINSRSIVATYLKIFDNIRNLFSSLPDAEYFDKSYFSFNATEGQCNTCHGLAEVDRGICPECLGTRYKAEILEIRYKDLNISEFLELSIDRLSSVLHAGSLSNAIEILKKLGLSHISLGRTTPTLSGGEAQRLKLAKVLIESMHKIEKGNLLFIMDEPTTGLSNKDIKNIYNIFDELLSLHNSIIVIEHNLEVIKNSDYIIDIGPGSGDNGGQNVFSGRFEKLIEHPHSITAKSFRNEYEEIDTSELEKPLLQQKKFTKNENSLYCHKLYLSDHHFELERDFAENYSMETDSPNHKYFKTKETLFHFIENLNDVEISFNPYTTLLFTYKKIPLSLKKQKIAHLSRLGFAVHNTDYKIDEWKYRVTTNDMRKAYTFGSGWVRVKSCNENCELFTRLVSIQNKLIGSYDISESTFNLYLNSCKYCKGNGVIPAYNIDAIIVEKSKSLLDTNFFYPGIKLPSLKSVIHKFAKEELFDFTKSFNDLPKEEKSIFLHGFKEYEFLKKNGRKDALSDYIRWEGIYPYIYKNRSKIENFDTIVTTKKDIDCPFCAHGFNKEVIHYILNKRNIVDFL